MDIYLYSEKGPLPQNEDCVLAVEDKKRGALGLIAADGLGGYGGGERASYLAAHIIGEGFLHSPTLEQGALEKMFCQAHEAIRREQTPRRRIKSTAAALFLLEGRAAAVHIGDSRVYRFSGGKIRWQTLDHSVPQLAVYAGEIGPEGIRSHPDRNRLYRALGGDSCEPQFTDLGETKGEVWLLCTDGFWEAVTEEMMERTLAGAKTPREWVEAMCREAEISGNPWQDNYSAVAFFG